MNLQEYLMQLHETLNTGREAMNTLRRWLDSQSIKWVDHSDLSMKRTRFWVKGNEWSVIFGEYSYGGAQGLLEVWTKNVNNGEPLGHLSASEVIKLIEKEFDKNGNESDTQT